MRVCAHVPPHRPPARNSLCDNEEMEERDFSRAKEAWMKKEEQAHEAVLEMLKKLEESKVGGHEGSAGKTSDDTRQKTERVVMDDENFATSVPRRVGGDNTGGEVRRNRRIGKFVEHLPTTEEAEDIETDATEENKADWRLSRMGPKLLLYEPAPWEDETTQSVVSSVERGSSQILEDIAEEEDSEPLPTQFVPPMNARPKTLTPPADYIYPSPPSDQYPIYKLPPEIFPAPSASRSPTTPVSPSSGFGNSNTSEKSPSRIRTRAGLKKIFLSTIRPRKRDDMEPPSPCTTISSTATTPSLPTPTIRISSPLHPRRFDGSPIYGNDHLKSQLSPIETGFRLPELRLSRADWSEWGRQVAERI